MSREKFLIRKQNIAMLQKIPKFLETLSWPKEKIKMLRQQRLRELLKHAKTHSIWYRDKLAHINVDRFTEENIPELPVMDKTALMDNWDKVVTRPELNILLAEQHLERIRENSENLFLLNRYHVIASGGSSGRRGVFVYDWNEWITYYLMTRRFHYQYVKPPYGKRSEKLAIIGAQKATHASYSIAKSFTSEQLNTYLLPITLPMDEIIKKLNKIQPDFLHGYPSAIYQLCKNNKLGKLNIRPNIISVGSEPCHHFIKETIKETWPEAKFFNLFASSEGFCAIQCKPDCSYMHINDDLCIIETVNENRSIVGSRQPSKKIYITNLFNLTLPLIRFEMNDEITFLNQACDCGSNLQLIEEPGGKTEFNFVYKNGVFVHHYAFLTYLLHERHIQEYQVKQTPTGADIMMLNTEPINKERIIHDITNELKQLGLANPKITINEIEHFDYPESGKLRRFIPLM
jgi:phenylacetate-coenzyme A ligase PaaK-like adenylate-forming protein